MQTNLLSSLEYVVSKKINNLECFRKYCMFSESQSNNSSKKDKYFRFYTLIMTFGLVILFTSCSKPKPVTNVTSPSTTDQKETALSSIASEVSEVNKKEELSANSENSVKESSSQQEQILTKSKELEDKILKLFRAADYAQALSLAEERLELLKDKAELEGELSTALNDVGTIYRIVGDYKKAEVFLTEALEIRERVFGPNSDEVAQALNNIAGVYRFKGDYDKAEKSYSRSVAIREKITPESLNTARSVFNLGHFYHIKGDYEKAETLYLRVFELLKKIKADEVELANVFNNLGQIAKDRKNYVEAENYYSQAVEIREKKLGPEHPFLALSINCLAEIEKFKGNYQKAEDLYIRSISIYEKKGIENAELANFLDVLGEVYVHKGDYKKAEETFLRSLAILDKRIGENHPYVTGAYNSLVNLYQNTQNVDLGIKYQRLLDESDEQNLLRHLGGGSERQKLAYLERISKIQDRSISFHVQSAPNNLQASQTALSTILRRKGRALDVLAQSVETLRQRATPEDQEILNTLAEKKKHYSNLSLELTLGQARAENLEKIKSELKVLAEEIDKLQIEISTRSSEFRSQTQKITFEAVKQAIPKNSTLIEFATYSPYDFQRKDFTENRNYVVYILDNKDELKFVDLGDSTKIDKLVNELRLAVRNKNNSVDKEIKPKAKELYQLVMSPILKLIGKREQLLLSPDGLLNLLPFAALIDEKGKYLVENYNLTYLASGRDLLKLQVKSDPSKRSLIVANPDFGVAESSSDLFNNLPETEKEAKVIKNLLPESDVLIKEAATEIALKQVKKPKILHIATHGFFFSQEDVSTNKESLRIIKIKRANPLDEKEVNPLLRSGLALSGANLLSSDSGENGILTSLEVAGLDLWGTKLVVLSACDTGVGEVKNGDGVYGLRRALTLSGAETQLISLWPVSDVGTKDLMSEYYYFLQAGEGRSEALRKVQLKMLKDVKRKHPFYWASFIPSGQWASLRDN